MTWQEQAMANARKMAEARAEEVLAEVSTRFEVERKAQLAKLDADSAWKDLANVQKDVLARQFAARASTDRRLKALAGLAFAAAGALAAWGML